jgi:Aerotolerance regulator N-terminal/von Willebrand factor type A domain
MNFLYPAFLLGGLAIAVPIVLHFLRRDVAPTVPFSAVRLLRRSPVARSKRRRLRDLLLLAARIAALLLLAAAFARPYLAHASRGPTLRIVAVDRSFSMNAPGQFAHAIDLARRAVDEASAGERVAVIAFDDHAETIAAPGPAAAARTALAGLTPTFGATRFGEVFTRAAEIAAGDDARLVLVSDLQRSGWDGDERGMLPDAVVLDLRNAGAPPANLAIVSLVPMADRVVAAVRNMGNEPRSGQIRIEHDGRPAASATYNVGSNSTADVAIPFRTPASGSIAVVIDDAAGLPADNSRYAVLDPVPPQSVLLVTGPGDSGYYVTRALAAVSAPAADRIAARSLSGQSLGRENLAQFSAVILLSTHGLDQRGRESLAGFVRRGGGLLIAGSPEVESAVVSAVFSWPPAMTGSVEMPGSTALSPTDPRHPIFRPFGALAANLGQVRFTTAWRLAAEGWEVVAHFTDGNPAVVERREGQGRVVLFASDLDRQWNDFPLHPAFVPFTVEAVRYVSGTRDRRRDYVVGAAPAAAGVRPGIYRVGSDNHAIAVNVDPRESSTAVLSGQQFAGMIEHVQGNQPSSVDARAAHLEARQSYWQYGLMLMLAALVAESFVGRA